MPLLEAAAERRNFDAQRARLPDGTGVLLAGSACLGPAGGLLGYVGGVFLAAKAQVTSPDESALHARLEEALRRPLDRIVAEADAMHAQADGSLAEHYVDYAADIASAGRHLLALIDDLADLNAIERTDFRVAPDEIDLADVARRAAGLLSVRAADTGIAIERPGLDQVLPSTGEFRRTLQILVNLLTNAVRYSLRGAAVTVTAERAADRGKGIAAIDQARVFGKFERVEPAEAGGSGLGLYIARRLARAMGGDLTVESARFTLALPAR